jgi:hypothetical protein
MATVEDVVRDVQGSVSSDAAYLSIVKWIDSRYKQLMSKTRFKLQRKIGELEVAANYSTGTATVSRGSTSVVGVGTTWVTDIGSGAQTDWYIRIKSAWYQISSVGGELAITLATNFSEDDASAASYTAVKRFHALNSTARWLGEFFLTRLRIPVKTVPAEQLDAEHPGRVLSSSFPLLVAQAPRSSDGYLRVELYPYSKNSEIIHYVYWDLPSTLAITTTIPQEIDPYVLKEGALIDMYRFLKSKAYHANRIDEGNSWRNDEMVQQGVWKKVMQEAARTDQAVDDATFILQTMDGRGARAGDIKTARDYVYNEWSWPDYR